MDRAKTEFIQPTNLSKSITFVPETQVPFNHTNYPFSNNPYKTPTKVPSCDTAGSSTKSNNSSINNILPCPDFTAAVKRTSQTSTNKSYIPKFSANDYYMRRSNFSQFKEKLTATGPSNAEMSSMRTNPRLQSSQTNVANGLSALHSKVDELLRRRSLSRDLDESSRYEKTPLKERPNRPSSIDSRPSYEAKTAQPYYLASLLKEVPKERLNTEPNINSGRTCYSIDVSPVKTIEGLETKIALNTEQREAPSPSRSILKDKYNSSIGKEKTPSPTRSRKEVRWSADTNIPSNNRILDSPEDRTRRAAQPYIGIRKQNSSAYEEMATQRNASFDQAILSRAPKYDVRKLDSIISRIQERNSVSPLPGQRSSITTSEVEAYRKNNINYSQNISSASNQNQEHISVRRGVRTEEKPYVPSTWFLSTLTKETEKSFDEISNNKSDFVSNANSSFLDLFEKKKDATSPRFNTEGEDNRLNMSRPSKITTEGLGSQIYMKRPTAAIYGKTDKGILNNFPSTIREMPEILKTIQNGNPIKIKDFSKERAELLKKAEPVQEKPKNFTGGVPEQRERLLEPYRAQHIDNNTQDNKETRKNIEEASNQPVGTEKGSMKYYCGEVENDYDSRVDPTNRKVLKTEDSMISVERNIEDKKEINEPKTSSLDKLISKRAESRTDFESALQQGKSLDEQYKEYLKAKKQKSPSRTENLTESRLSTENDHNYLRAGSFTRVCAEMCESPIHHTEDENLTANESVFSIKQDPPVEVKSSTKDNLKERLKIRIHECTRANFDSNTVKDKFLANESIMSDFDFEKNKLDTTMEVDQSKGNAKDFKLKLCKFEQDNEDAKKIQPGGAKLTNFSSFGTINEKLLTKIEWTKDKGY